MGETFLLHGVVIEPKLPVSPHIVSLFPILSHVWGPSPPSPTIAKTIKLRDRVSKAIYHSTANVCGISAYVNHLT